MQSAFSWAPNVTRKCESKHWYACGADGRSVGRSLGRSVGHVITKFSGMGRFIYAWCSAGALRARSSAIMHICVRNYCICNKYMGLYRNLTDTYSHIGMSYRGQENNKFECCPSYSLSCSQSVEILGLCYT